LSTSTDNQTPDDGHDADLTRQAEPPPGGELDDARMSIIEHLTELRRRLLYMLAGLLIGFIASWFVIDILFTLLLQPLEWGAQMHGAKPDFANMHHKDIAEPFFVYIKTAFLAGAIVSAPVGLYQLWKFIAPGLYDSEKSLLAPFVIFGTLFFAGGVSFAFFIVMPYGFNFLLTFAKEVSDPQLMMDEYFSIATKLLLGFGAVFELPVLSLFLSKLGVITHRTLIDYWRIALVVAFLLAAMLTPPDIFTQLLMAGPLLLLYLLSVAIAWWVTRSNG
jgi:sec-independent protein translocase protein TatC